MVRTLVVFDIDGTLTRSNDCDALAFVRAIADVLGLPDISQDWAAYTHVTDSGILSELVHQAFDRAPTSREQAAVEERCCVLLTEYLSRSGLAAVSGAARLLAHLSADPSWDVTFATGAWLQSAAAKLHAAGLSLDLASGASANDAISRQDIVRTAIDRGGGGYERIVSVGDGVWDVKTATALGMPFMGISAESDAQALYAAGAGTVLTDFADLDLVIDAFEQAMPPDPPS